MAVRFGFATVTATLPASLGGAVRTSPNVTVNEPTIAFTAGPTPATIDVSGSPAPNASTISVAVNVPLANDAVLNLLKSGTASVDFVACGTTTPITSLTLPQGETSATFCVRALGAGQASIQVSMPLASGGNTVTLPPITVLVVP